MMDAMRSNRRYDLWVRLIWLLVVGCAAGRAPTPRRAAPPAPVREVIEVAPHKPTPRPPLRAPRGRFDIDPLGNNSAIDDIIYLEPRPTRRVEDDRMAVSDLDLLGRCAREVVQARPEPARRALVTVLVRYHTSCDANGRVVLERLLGDRDRRTRSDIGFVGTVGRDRMELALRVATCNGESASPDRIAIVTDTTRWTSPRLEFARDANNCDAAQLPFTNVLGRMLDAAIRQPEAKLAFEGTDAELVLDDAIKSELVLVLDAYASFAHP